MEIKPIRSEADYTHALREVEQYFENAPEPGSAADDRFEILLALIEKYEALHYPIAPPDPIEAIKFRMEQSGLKAKDLIPMIGGLNRVYEILNRKRPLTLAMIRRLHNELGIPAESLIAEASANVPAAKRSARRLTKLAPQTPRQLKKMAHA